MELLKIKNLFTNKQTGNTFNMFYRQDGKGASSNNTGFFFIKQGTLETVEFNLNNALSNPLLVLTRTHNEDVWLYNLDNNGNVSTEWTKVPVTGANVIYNSLSQNVPSLYAIQQ